MPKKPPFIDLDTQVLILAHYFPPSNSTASDRTYYWLKHLQNKTNNIRVVCKNWGSIEQLPEKDLITQVSIEDRLLKKIGITPGIKKVYKQFSPILEPLWLLQGEEDLVNAASEFISGHKKVVLITSSSPYSLFKVGFLLKKKHPHISWIADYRDEWSSRELVNFKIPVLSNMLIAWSAFLEKKWIAKATCFTTVSQVLSKRISEVHKHKIPGYVIENGYDKIRERKTPSNHSEIHFAYTGNVYKVQDFEQNLVKIAEIAKNYPSVKTKVSFVGGAFSNQRKKKMQKLCGNINLEFVDYMKKKDLDVFNNQVDVFLMAAYGSIQGYQSSKIYYYISMQKPVFLFPSDNDVMEEILTDSGIKINDLNRIYQAKAKSEEFKVSIASEKYLYKYSREAGTEKLAQIIQKITSAETNKTTAANNIMK